MASLILKSLSYKHSFRSSRRGSVKKWWWTQKHFSALQHQKRQPGEVSFDLYQVPLPQSSRPTGGEDGLVRPMGAKEPVVAEAAPVEDEASRAPEAGRVGGEAVRPIIDWGTS